MTRDAAPGSSNGAMNGGMRPGFFGSGLFRFIGRKRVPFTLLIMGATLPDIFFGKAHPLSLFKASGNAIISWVLIALGVAIRLWAAGNLRKNEIITTEGIYSMVRHPLYLGTSLVYLAYLISFGDLYLGLILYFVMMAAIYYPRMIQEEEALAERFPLLVKRYMGIPRIVPNPLRLPEALRTDRFSWDMALKNHGLVSLWSFAAVPVALFILDTLRDFLIGH